MHSFIFSGSRVLCMHVIKGIHFILFFLVITIVVVLPVSSVENSTIMNTSSPQEIVNSPLVNTSNLTTVVIPERLIHNNESLPRPGTIAPELVSFVTDAETGSEYVSDEVIVRFNTTKFRNTKALESSSAVSHAKIGAQVKKDFSEAGLSGMQVVKLTSNVSVKDAIREYQKNSDVVYVQPNYVYHTTALIPNDPSFNLQWGLHNTGQQVNGITGSPDADIDAPEAWDNSTGSNTVIIAVIDSGVHYTHPDLVSNMWINADEIPGNNIDDDNNGYIDDVYGWNFYDGNNDPNDGNSPVYHGTHCAGILGAVGNNGVGVCGVTWNIKIMSLRTTDAYGSSYTSDDILAINYANANGASIISNSWGGYEYDQALKDAIDNSPTVVVCSAGNDNTNTDTSPFYPASFNSPNIISVAATDSSDYKAAFSNYGPISVDLGAPGVNIYSTKRSSDYQFMSGTSMATPFVAGVAALVKSVNPQLTNIQIKNIILNNIDVKPSLAGMVITSGRLNANKAVKAAQSLAQPDKIGVYKDGAWYLDYNGNGTWDGPVNDKAYSFGGPGNISVVGDWNGDGRDKIGVTNSVYWYLDSNGDGFNSPGVDKAPYFGIMGFTPVLGEWNGDGKTKVGVYNSGIWYLDYNGNGTWDGPVNDKAYSFGGPGNVSVVGDWNGDGITEIGVTNGVQWYLDYNGNGAWDGSVADRAPYFGIAGYGPVVGDWNGDGKTEVGVTNGVQWYLDYNGNGAWDGPVVDRAPYFGIAGFTPVIGDWNGDGIAEIGVTNSVNWYLDYNGNGTWDGPVVDRAPYFGIYGFTPFIGKWQ
jgi:subtilisin family serine protease